MRIICHRAGNSLRVLESVVRAGFTEIEGDVTACYHRDRFDGFVMIHPSDVERKTPEGHAAYAVEELQALKAEQGVEVPTIQEVVQAVKEYGVQLHLESKVPGTFALLELIPKLVLPHKQITPMSFFGSELAYKWKYRHAGGGTGISMHHSPTADVLKAMKIHYGSDAIIVGPRLITRTLIRDAHWSLMKVIAAVVNDPADAVALDTLGVDGIITDHPVELWRHLGPRQS